MPDIYTKTGDAGETGLIGGQRVSKDAIRIEAYGTVDELNATLGVARVGEVPADMDRLLEGIQHELFVVGAELAAPHAGQRGVPAIRPTQVVALEKAIDRYEVSLPPLRQFILPAGGAASAHLHLARTVCRRAERRLVSLCAVEPEGSISPQLVPYLNRLGDLLFVLARAANAAADVADQPWQHPSA